MLIVTLFGLLMAYFCLFMIVNPSHFSQGIITFSEKPYFHVFEILSRITVGILFVLTAAETALPLLITLIGYGLIAVGFGLMLTAPAKHRRFAVWSARRFNPFFRVIGITALPFAFALIWIAQCG